MCISIYILNQKPQQFLGSIILRKHFVLKLTAGAPCQKALKHNFAYLPPFNFSTLCFKISERSDEQAVPCGARPQLKVLYFTAIWSSEPIALSCIESWGPHVSSVFIIKFIWHWSIALSCIESWGPHVSSVFTIKFIWHWSQSVALPEQNVRSMWLLFVHELFLFW
jgi:hypothetical protein